MLQLLVMLFLAVRNGARAKLKGDSPVLWGFITFGAIFLSYFIGTCLVVFFFCRDAIDFSLLSAGDAKSREAAANQLADLINNNYLNIATINIIGIGGYLLTRYIIDSRPDKRKPEVNWMEKVEEPGADKS